MRLKTTNATELSAAELAHEGTVARVESRARELEAEARSQWLHAENAALVSLEARCSEDHRSALQVVQHSLDAAQVGHSPL